MFQNGYDTRAFVAELIPVIIFETLIRCYWFYKQKFYYGKSFKESLPIANSRELSRLLLVGNATFTQRYHMQLLKGNKNWWAWR